MKKTTIRVEIQPNGDASIDVDGFSGKGCMEATRALEEALGKTLYRSIKPGGFKSEAQETVTVKK